MGLFPSVAPSFSYGGCSPAAHTQKAFKSMRTGARGLKEAYFGQNSIFDQCASPATAIPSVAIFPNLTAQLTN